jgi:hypothetical protein
MFCIHGNEEGTVEEHLFAFPKPHSVTFPILEEITLIPVKPSGFKAPFNVAHGCIL